MTDLDMPIEPARAVDVDAAETLSPSFKGVVLVCGECEDRSNGPRKLTSKDVRKRLKESLRPAKGRLRVVLTGCMGPCPKKAMTVAVVAGGDVSMKAVCREAHVEALAAEALALVT